ncbi:hypothetical protein CC80DRAFT_531005 [Byssothecium circinans]|uniref:Uncharacterized protein n=1 Tax=Byssothecium circinans TaxID=147558 RepID=A0A6A5UEI4_9PLEO|nr:hypothetical protein CC80DRAFT_531005 [Byssothecium circinans]
MGSLPLLVLTLLTPLVAAKGGGRGGGGSSSGGGGGGGGSSGGSGKGAGGGATTLPYSTQECYTSSLGAVYMLGNETSRTCTKHPSGDNSDFCYWIWDDAHKNDSINYLTSLPPYTKDPSPNWALEIFDAYYNGTLTLTLTPPPSNATYNCPLLTSTTLPDAYLRLGPSSRGSLSRSAYGDKNPFYFQLGRSIFTETCPVTPNKVSVNFESSNDNTENAQVWSLAAPKKEGADTWKIEGSLSSTKASYNNYWNYIVNTTGAEATYPKRTCPTVFSLRTLLANTGAKMNGSVTAASADVGFSFLDPETKWTVSGAFSGKHWGKGARVVFDKEGIVTEGQAAEHVKPRKPAGRRSFMSRYGKYIFIAVGVVAGLGVCLVLWCCCGAVVACCCPCCSQKKREERRRKKAMQGYGKGMGGDVSPYQANDSQMAYKQPMETVRLLMPHDPRDSQNNYAVSPVVMQSYYIRGGMFLTEIAEAQMDLHGAQMKMGDAARRGDNEGLRIARAMVGHYTGIVEHYMGLRGAGI